MKAKRGALIVFEGCDRVGKSTQVNKLMDELKKRSISVANFAFPNRSTKSGKLIDSYLTTRTMDLDNILSSLPEYSRKFGRKRNRTVTKEEILHTLFSFNRREVEPDIRRLLSEGTTVVIDRYSFSGVAFSAASKLDKSWCWQQEHGLPKPDLVLLLRMPLEKAATRNGYGNEIFENFEFQKKVQEEYHKMIDSSWKVIDVDGKDIETVNGEILVFVENAIVEARCKPLGQFK